MRSRWTKGLERSRLRVDGLRVAVSGICTLGILALDVLGHVASSSFLVVPVVLAAASRSRLAAAASIAASAIWLGTRHTLYGVPSLTEAGVHIVAWIVTGTLVSAWATRDGRRVRVAAAAASCAADVLHRTTTRFQALLDSAHDPLLLVDPSGVILAASSGTHQVLGYSSTELAGRRLGELFPELASLLGAPDPAPPPDPREAPCDTDPAEALEPHAPAAVRWSGEYEAHASGGRRLLCEVTAGRMTHRTSQSSDDGTFLIQLRDLTLRRTREIERLHAQKMQSIGQLATGIAHEVNTPAQYVGDNLRFIEKLVGPVSEGLRQLESQLDGPDTHDPLERAAAEPALKALRRFRDQGPEAIREALEGIDRISTIVRAMRQFSHPGTTDYVQLDVNQAIHDTLTITRHEWRYVARILPDLEPTLPSVPCLPGELGQILVNLIVNAAHAVADAQDPLSAGPGEPRGEIGIRTRRVGDGVEIRIRDTGTGISDSIRERIFDPFFTTKEVGRGSGQGLAIVHAIVLRHRGTIHCTSQLGLGSEFVVSLPLQHADARRHGAS